MIRGQEGLFAEDSGAQEEEREDRHQDEQSRGDAPSDPGGRGRHAEDSGQIEREEKNASRDRHHASGLILTSTFPPASVSEPARLSSAGLSPRAGSSPGSPR